MRTPVLASLSVLATALACGAGILSTPARAPEQLVPARRAAPPPAPLAGLEIAPALLPVQDGTNARVTPVVKAVQRAADSVVSIYLVDRRRRSADGQGSGVILDENGLVITNWHVVFPVTRGDSYELRVHLRDQRKLAARVVSTSPVDDLALLSLDLSPGEMVQPIALGDSGSLMIGETLIAIGNPRGHANTVTVGVLSAEDRSINVRTPDGGVRSYEGLLQTDAAINQGNSGGALLDITGRLVGINNAMAVSAENIGFAIPVNTVRRVFQDVLLASDNLANVWTGMRVDEADGHVVVSEVDPLGPAARAGIRAGDRILSAAGLSVGNRVDYARRVLQARPGQQFQLRLQRDGRDVSARLVPMDQTSFELVRRVGVEVETVTNGDEPQLVREASLAFYGDYARRVPLLPGVVRVVRVYPDSAAAELRLREGDILLGYGHTDWWGDYRESAFSSAADLADKIRIARGSIPIIVLRGERVLEGNLEVRR